MTGSAQPSVETALADVLTYARTNSYIGYGKFDALNSPLIKVLTLNNKWLRLIASQFIKLFPFNIRPLLGVRKSANPKGMALFAQSYLRQYKATRDERFLSEAKTCLDWLLADRSEGYSGDCWGYHWDWQDLDFLAPNRSPNCVVTCHVGQAMLDGYEAAGDVQYRDAAASSVDFILKDLPVLHEDRDTLCIGYVPDDRLTMRVMDVSALAGALIARVDSVCNTDANRSTAQRLMRYVARQQTRRGAWFYTDPPDRSPRTHDNYHTAFILDAFMTYAAASGIKEFEPEFTRGLDFYREQLFLTDGAPKWTDTEPFPHDAHSAGTAIGTLARAAARTGDAELLAMAQMTASWAIEHLRRTDGAFSYQKSRFAKKRFTLMRWCNGWMAAGLSQLILTRQSETL